MLQTTTKPTMHKTTDTSQDKLPRPLLICGPSGAGKGTLRARLRHAFPGLFAESVSHTTRKPRAGETHGVDYHYVTEAEFEATRFIETFTSGTRKYGTSVAELRRIRDSGAIALFEVHPSSAEKIKRAAGAELRTELATPVSVFVRAGDAVECRRRIVERAHRGGDRPLSDDELDKRVRDAEEQLGFAEENPRFFDVIVDNSGCVDDAFDALVAALKLVYASEFAVWEARKKSETGDISVESDDLSAVAKMIEELKVAA